MPLSCSCEMLWRANYVPKLHHLDFIICLNTEMIAVTLILYHTETLSSWWVFLSPIRHQLKSQFPLVNQTNDKNARFTYSPTTQLVAISKMWDIVRNILCRKEKWSCHPLFTQCSWGLLSPVTGTWNCHDCYCTAFAMSGKGPLTWKQEREHNHRAPLRITRAGTQLQHIDLILL